MRPLQTSAVEVRAALATALPQSGYDHHSGTHSKAIVELRAANTNDRSLSACRIENGGARAAARDAHAPLFQVT
jgi:hypothetical protein